MPRFFEFLPCAVTSAQALRRHVYIVLGAGGLTSAGLLDDIITLRRVPEHVEMQSGSMAPTCKGAEPVGEVEAITSKTKKKKSSV